MSDEKHPSVKVRIHDNGTSDARQWHYFCSTTSGNTGLPRVVRHTLSINTYGGTFDHTVYGPAKLHKPNRIFACQNIGVG